jgi:hypothetical protein
VTRCEIRFESFNAGGDDRYLDRFSRRLDELFISGWIRTEVQRDTPLRGQWQVVLFRESAARPLRSSAEK